MADGVCTLDDPDCRSGIAAMSVFDDRYLAKLKRQLLQTQGVLQRLEKRTRADVEPVELDQTRVGRITRMDALQDQAMSQEARRRRQAELSKIADALRRIRDGHYGYCEECSRPISVARLDIDPAAPLCIACANELEK